MDLPLQRVQISPVYDVYHPGDVLTVAIFFSKPWVGEVEVGLSADSARSGTYPTSVFARSNAGLYEGQVHVRQEHVGACRLVATFSGVTEPAVTEPILAQPILVRPVAP